MTLSKSPMKSNQLSPTALAEVIHSALDLDDSTQNQVYQERREVKTKFYVGPSSISVLHLSGASNSLNTMAHQELDESLSCPASDSTGILEFKPHADSSTGERPEHPYNKIDVGWSMKCM